MIEFDVDMSYLLDYDELDKVVLRDENGEHEPMEFVPKDAATVGRSCASCPEMDNPDSYIVHLHRAIEVADDGVGTCHMRLAYEEEDADGCIWPDHYECDACGAKVNGIMPFYDTEIPPKYCPNCRARVIKED